MRRICRAATEWKWISDTFKRKEFNETFRKLVCQQPSTSFGGIEMAEYSRGVHKAEEIIINSIKEKVRADLIEL